MTGFGLERVHITPRGSAAKKHREIPKLWELKLTGWAGMASETSGIKLRYDCPGCGHLSYTTFTDASKLIVTEQWDGSDFFMVWPLPRYIFVSQRVHDIVERERLTGCQLIPVEELESPLAHGIDTMSPGRLHQCMPEERARELGEPLGIY